MIRILFASLILIVLGCTTAPSRSTHLVLDYSDFGPQAVAYPLIGTEWWQWMPHGDSRPKQYDVKVVVYQESSLEEVQKRYPVIEEDNQDYRYVACPDALAYLNEKISEDVLEAVTARLIETRAAVPSAFGEDCR